MLHRFWPAPALLAWLLAWVLHLGLRHAQAPVVMQFGLPAGLSLCLALWPVVANNRWRTVMVAAGFPISAGLVALFNQEWQGSSLHGWVWLSLLGLLLLAYPVKAWRDAPVFPTPKGALCQLPSLIQLRGGAQVLDAGCGLGHGLMALHDTFPQAICHGIEWSWPLSVWCRWYCPWASVRQGDLWAQNWAPFDAVYVFQRPESMPKIWAKAQRELKPGAWLVSLAFGIPGVHPAAQLQQDDSLVVWVYRIAK